MNLDRFVSRSWATNGTFGVLSILAGLVLFAWPQLALMLVIGTLGLNLVLLGGYLLWTAIEQKRLDDLGQRPPLEGHARRVYVDSREERFGGGWAYRIFPGR